MASEYTPLKLQLMETGENLGTWGVVTNVNLGTAIEEAIVGSANVTFASNDETLTLSNTNSTQVARHLRLNLIGVTGGSIRNLTVPNIEKVYIIRNGCADTIQVRNSTGSNIAVPAGKTMWVYSTGTNVVDVVTHLSSLTLGAPLPVESGGTGANSLSGISFSGQNITDINASNVSSGTLANARTTASSSNGANTIVQRDASGNFSANTVTANLSGNVTGNLTGTASNATVLQTARTIAIQDAVTGTATSFDGSANISISATGINASAINSGTISNERTTASSSNIANTIVSRDAAGSFTANNVNATSFIGGGSGITNINASNISSGTIANSRTTASSSNIVSTIVARDSSGNFSANTITANISGNVTGNVTGNLTGTASNAATLQTARTISISGGVFGSATSFNGSSNITIPVTSINASVIDIGTLPNSRTTASSSNVVNTIVQRDSFGNFSANTITANLAGTASNAATLQNARTIGISGGATGTATSFNGSSNITIPVTGLNVSTANAGVLAASVGGTGLTSPGTAGNVLTSNGSAWVSQASQAGLSGAVVKSQTYLYSTFRFIPENSYTGISLNSNALPQNTQGALLFTTSYIPRFSDSIIRVDMQVNMSPQLNSRTMVACLFNSLGTGAILSSATYVEQNSRIVPVVGTTYFTAGTTSSISFSVKASSAPTLSSVEAAGFYVNGSFYNGSGPAFGGTFYTSLTFTEYRP